jgi:hypothetical protein
VTRATRAVVATSSSIATKMVLSFLLRIGGVWRQVTVPPGKDMEAQQELVRLLEDALAAADNLDDDLVAAHISQALDTLRRRL